MTNTIDPTSAEVAHTAWCDRTECARSEQGWHRFAPWTLGGDEHTGLEHSITVHVTQHSSGSGLNSPALIDMTVRIPPVDETDTEDQDYLMLLTPERALALGRLLLAAGQAATGQAVP